MPSLNKGLIVTSETLIITTSLSMDDSLKIYWKLYYEMFSNELMIHKSHNMLRDFEEEFIEGPILELGCGQSNFLVEFSKTGKEIFAIDNQEFQLNLLNKRIETYAGKDAGKLYLLNITIPEKEIPQKVFSLVIASDFLHFFSIDECKKNYLADSLKNAKRLFNLYQGSFTITFL